MNRYSLSYVKGLNYPLVISSDLQWASCDVIESRDLSATRGAHVKLGTRARCIETFVGDKSGRREVQERVSQEEGVGRAEEKLKNPQILQVTL